MNHWQRYIHPAYIKTRACVRHGFWPSMHISEIMPISEMFGKRSSSVTLECLHTFCVWSACFFLCVFFFWRVALVECHYTPSLAPDSPCDVPTLLTGSFFRLLRGHRILHDLWVAIKWKSLTQGTSFVAWVTGEKNSFYKVELLPWLSKDHNMEFLFLAKRDEEKANGFVAL